MFSSIYLSLYLDSIDVYMYMNFPHNIIDNIMYVGVSTGISLYSLYIWYM